MTEKLRFQPTRPLRGATDRGQRGRGQHRRISTHAPLAGRDDVFIENFPDIVISTHAPLAGRDRAGNRWQSWRRHFNPRAPCGARRRWMILPCRALNFNPRAPCGARLLLICLARLLLLFQPTRPLRGATWETCAYTARYIIFQPTRPLRGATANRCMLELQYHISTHAPLAGRDFRNETRLYEDENFNPRAPCGARQGGQGGIPSPSPYFNPRAPCGARRFFCGDVLHVIHFNPRAPCGARQQKCTNHYAHFCDNRQISDAFAQNAACQGILLLFDAGKPCGFWVRTAQVISARLCFAL